MKRMLFVFLLTILLQPAAALGAMTGGNFNIPFDTVSVGAGGDVTGGDYTLELSGETADTGSSTAGDFTLYPGFFGGDGGSVTLSLSATTIAFGTLSLTSVSSGSITATVTTDSVSGYALTATEDGNLRDSGGNTIDDVTDGEVTAGSEEYGISTSGTDGSLASDTAISGTVTVASSTSPASANETAVTFKVSVGQSTQSGIYSHTVTFSLSANP